jgi:tetratricopeptide (TPR) repeat protein
MTGPAQRSARAAHDAARPAVARLDSMRGGEDLAADLIETWSAVEAALRTLVGSNALTGQALIREARQRQLIDFDLANTLAEFEAAHVRLQNTSYRPTETDVAAARNAYLKLDAALVSPTLGVGNAPYGSPYGAPYEPGRRAETVAPPVAEARTVEVAPAPVRRRRGWLWPVVALVLLLVVVGGYFLFAGNRTSAMQEGVAAYQRGQREVAVSAFNKAARDNPKDPMPHVYLARMAREVGNYSLASNELQLALQADPNNAIALREMGANLLQQGNAELARRFYVRAVQADPTDKMAQGYLGCALLRLGRMQEGNNFMNRAGPGPWTSCVTTATQPQQQQVAPGASIPR